MGLREVSEEMLSIKDTLSYINDGHAVKSIKNIELRGKYTNELMARLNELQSQTINPSKVVSSPINYENSEALNLDNENQSQTINPSEVVSSPINYEHSKHEALMLEAEFEQALENGITGLTNRSSLNHIERQLKKSQKRINILKRRLASRKKAEHGKSQGIAKGTGFGGGWRKSKRKSTRKSRKSKRKSRKR